MKSTLTLTILITGAALLTAICADEQTVIPPDHKQEADKTAAGMHYYIWPATNAPITSTKIAGTFDARLLVSLNFKAKDNLPESFCWRMKAVTKSDDSATAVQTTRPWTVCDDSSKSNASGRTVVVFAARTAQLLPGKGEATIHLVKKSDETNPEAKPISNETTVKIVIEP